MLQDIYKRIMLNMKHMIYNVLFPISTDTLS